MRRKVRGVILIVVGLLLVVGGIGLFAFYDHQDQMAGRNSEIILTELRGYQEDGLQVRSAVLYGEDNMHEQTLEDETVLTYAGYNILGTVWIPSVEIELPVLADRNEALLDVAPCCYSGSISGGDMIVMGHNYKSHFNPLHRVEIGAMVQLEDIHGIIYQYEVAKIEYLHKNEGKKLASEYPLTLFTCTAGGQNRLIVRCQ